MKKGLVNIKWNYIEDLSNEDISYFLFLEGKSIEVISKIRGLETSEVQRHIIEGKIKYRLLSKSNNIEELFHSIATAGKQDKLRVLNSLDDKTKQEILKFVKDRYIQMSSKDKEAAVWIVGELRDVNSKGILIKGSVHKSFNVRRLSVSAIGKLQDKDLEMTLIRALDDSNPQVVTYAIGSLAKIKGKKAKEKIESLKAKSDKAYIIRAADKYLETIDEENLGIKKEEFEV